MPPLRANTILALGFLLFVASIGVSFMHHGPPDRWSYAVGWFSGAGFGVMAGCICLAKKILRDGLDDA